jgi:hypothetical protein
MSLDAAVLERWMADEPVPGVCFRLNDPVRIVAGPHRHHVGYVVALVDLSPEPLFTVELPRAGYEVHARQSELCAL